jgi:hypothetical protein
MKAVRTTCLSPNSSNTFLNFASAGPADGPEDSGVTAALQRKAAFLWTGVARFGGVAGAWPGGRRLRRAPAQRADRRRCVGQALEHRDLLRLRAGDATRCSVNHRCRQRDCRDRSHQRREHCATQGADAIQDDAARAGAHGFRPGHAMSPSGEWASSSSATVRSRVSLAVQLQRASARALPPLPPPVSNAQFHTLDSLGTVSNQGRTRHERRTSLACLPTFRRPLACRPRRGNDSDRSRKATRGQRGEKAESRQPRVRVDLAPASPRAFLPGRRQSKLRTVSAESI